MENKTIKDMENYTTSTMTCNDMENKTIQETKQQLQHKYFVTHQYTIPMTYSHKRESSR